MADENAEAEVETEADGAEAAADGAEVVVDESVKAQPDQEVAADTEKAEPAKAESWLDRFTDDKLRDHAGKYTSAQELAKAHRELRQQMSNAVFLPGKGASAEDLAKFRKQIGVPESADGYEWTTPKDHKPSEAETAQRAEINAKLHEANFTQAQQKVIDAVWQDMQQRAAADGAKQQKKAIEGAQEALRTEWGGDYDANERAATAAWAQFGGDQALEDIKLEGGGRLGDHPGLMKMFAQIGRATMESRGIAGMDSAAADSLKEEYDRLLDEQAQARAKGDTSQVKRLAARSDELARKMWGTGPISHSRAA